MTWEDARIDAEKLLMELQLPATPKKLDLTVILHVYEDERAYCFYCQMQRWTWEYHTMVIRALKRRLAPRVHVTMLPVRLPSVNTQPQGTHAERS